MIKKIVFMILSILIFNNVSYSQCSSFCFCIGDTVLFGNTLDWYFEDGLIVVNKRNVSKTALGFSNPAKWASKYGSITINQWGREFPQRGMNEAGLAVGEMTLSETEYPADDRRPAISNPQWIQYQLDNCATVAEVIATDSKIRMDKNEYHSHFFVADSNGDCVTMEWLNGKLVYHTGNSLPIKALTNSTYQSLLDFYAQKKPHPENDYCTWARFYRIADMLENYNRAANGSALEYAWKIHAAVHNPGRTRWTLLFDLKRLRFYITTSVNSNIRYLDIKACDFSCSTPVKMLDANALVTGDIQSYLIDYDAAMNSALIRKIAEAHGPITGTVPEWYIENSARYPETTVCETKTSVMDSTIEVPIQK
jgi:penicillin V acylase-like amidase (Ntn superfamily)